MFADRISCACMRRIYKGEKITPKALEEPVYIEQLSPEHILLLRRDIMSLLLKKIIFILLCIVCFSSLSSEKTYYEILSVSPKATQEEITQAYNRLMSQPNQDHSATMLDIQLAYITLKDEKLRKFYDKRLYIQSANAEAFYSDIQETRNQWMEVSKQEFNQAYLFAVGKSYPYTRAFNLYFIATAGFELSYEQIFSILSIAARVRTEPRFVRIAALTVLSRYVNQLIMDDINVLLLLSSSKNRVDDRHLNKNKDKENSTEEKLNIKQMTRDIADQWLKIQFENSERIDRIISAVVNTDNTGDKYLSMGRKRFKKFVLQALEDQYAEKLTPEHIRLLQSFSRRKKRYLFKIRNIVKKWNQAGNACPNQIKKLQ